MGHEKDGKEVEQGRDKGDFDDFEVRSPGELRYEESTGAHDRGHERAAQGGGCFDGTCGFGGVAGLFHQRDSEGPGADHVGGAASVDHTHETAGKNSRFGRPAPGPSRQTEGESNEKAAGPGLFQKRTEDDELKDHRGADRGNRSEYSLQSSKAVRDDGFVAVASMCQLPWKIRSQVGVKDRKDCDDGQCQSQHPSPRFDAQNDGDRSQQDVPDRGRKPHALGQRRDAVEPVSGYPNREKRQEPVVERRPFERRALPRRVQEKNQEQADADVSSAVTVDGEDTESGCIEVEERKGCGNGFPRPVNRALQLSSFGTCSLCGRRRERVRGWFHSSRELIPSGTVNPISLQ